MARSTADQPKVALIGCGVWGSNHARVLHELGVLAMLCDADEARLRGVADQYPGVETTANPSDVFGSPAVDAVVIAAPAVAHAALAREALLADKDVLVEKPMALSVDDGEELCELAESRGRILAVGHVLEYHPAVLALTRLVADGQLGRVRYMYANRVNFGRIRTEESVLWSFAPHDVAIMNRLLAPPRSVSSQGSSYLNPGVADVTLTQLDFGGGVRGHIFVSWIHPFKEHRFVVVGDRRMAVFDDTAPPSEKLVVYEHEVDWVGGQIPVARKASGEAVPIDGTEPLRAQAEAFVTAVIERRPPVADGRSGLQVLKVLLAAHRSIETGGAVEPISTTPGAFVHPTAVVDPAASVGDDSKVWHFVHVMADAQIGSGCVLGQNVFVGRGVKIGDRTRIQNNVSVYEGVELESDVFVGPSVVFTNVRAPRSEDLRRAFDRTVVRSGASLGANSTIVCGSEIGAYAIVGAGSVVTKDVGAHAVVVGNPARFLAWACRCGTRFDDDGDLTCPACGRRYVRGAGGLQPA
jgi:UDP-2-acetamido-3-amino-2,3-dideoxy-glucuronate N-acetyltransferase